MKKTNQNVLIVLIIIAIAVLTYSSYLAGYKASENKLDSLLMTMSIDSNFVIAGLYEELPNNLRKTMHFYIEDAPSVINDVKLFAQVKYVTIGGREVEVKDGNIWGLIKDERVFQRQFEDKKDSANNENVPDSPYAENSVTKIFKNNSL